MKTYAVFHRFATEKTPHRVFNHRTQRWEKYNPKRHADYAAPQELVKPIMRRVKGKPSKLAPWQAPIEVAPTAKRAKIHTFERDGLTYFGCNYEPIPVAPKFKPLRKLTAAEERRIARTKAECLGLQMRLGLAKAMRLPVRYVCGEDDRTKMSAAKRARLERDLRAFQAAVFKPVDCGPQRPGDLWKLGVQKVKFIGKFPKKKPARQLTKSRRRV